MECADLRAALLSGHTPRGPEVDAHAADCAACAELLAGDAALGRELAHLARSAAGGAIPEEPRVDFGAVRSALAADHSAIGWLRSRTTFMRVGSLLVVALCVALVQLGGLRRVDFDLYPTTPLLVVIAAFSLLIGLALAACVRPLHEPRLSPWALRGLLAAGVLMPLLLYVGRPVHTAHPASLAGAGADLVSRAGACFVYGMLLAVPVLVLARLLDRGEHRIGKASLCAALAGGLTANLALHLHCPITHAGHLVLGHATLVVVLLGVYAAADQITARLR